MTHKQQHCILVLGMHRSGTSALAGVLQLLGVNLGKDLMSPVKGDNPKGFFENTRIYHLNEAILECLDSSWDDPFPLPERWWTQEQFSPYKQEIARFLKSEFSESCLFGMKDPRFCHLLPLWQEVLKELHISVSFIILVRNPLEIAASLAERDGFPVEKSGILWMNAMFQAELSSRGSPRLFLSFDDVLKYPQTTVETLSNSLAITFPHSFQDIEQSVYTFLNPDLKHHHIEDKTVNKQLLSFMSAYYQILQNFVNAPDIPKKELTKINRLRKNFSEVSRWFYHSDFCHTVKMLKEKTVLLHKKEEELQRLRPRYYAQLYIDTGSGFHEEHSIRKAISGLETQLEFDLSEYEYIKELRFDPINTLVAIKLQAIKIISINNNLYTKLPQHTNALYQDAEVFLFETSDPNIHIDLQDIFKPQRLVIQLEYLAWGAETYRDIAGERLTSLQERDQQLRQQTQFIQAHEQQIQRQTQEIQAQKQELQYQIQTLRAKDQELQRQAEILRIREQEAQQHIQTLNAHKQEIQQLTQALQAKDQELQQLSRDVDAHKQEIHHLTHRIQAKTQELQQQSRTLQDKEWESRQKNQKIQAIYNTLSWRLTAPLRTIWNICHLSKFFYTLRKIRYHIRARIIGKNRVFSCLETVKLSDHSLTVSGWALSESGIDRIEIYLDSLFVGHADYGRERLDVEKIYPFVFNSRNSGFYFYAGTEKIPKVEDGEHEISVKAITMNKQVSDMEVTTILAGEAKKQFHTQAETALNAFLETSDGLVFPEFDVPVLTVILVLFNRSELTFQCLESIKTHADVAYEIVIVDNASSDQTVSLLERLHKVKILKNTENVGFLKACNQAADHAQGKYLLFLNNDTQVLPQTFSSLVNTIEADPSIGVVGGKLIFPNGRLQEAGDIIWRDGSCLGYGRGDDPKKPEYSYLREVHYCSGALLLTPRKLFLELEKFDERYAPAYCEEVDYCMTVREHGLKVLYQPLAQVIHYEFASSTRSKDAIQLQLINREKFKKKWSEKLSQYHEPQPNNILFAREYDGHKHKKRVLFLDDRVPDPKLGSGFPRSFDILNALVAFGYQVTFFPMQFTAYSASVAEHFQQRGVEIIYDHTGTQAKLNFQAFWSNRCHYYDIVLISRPHNMEEILQFHNIFNDHTKIVYDCEAIFAMREYLYNRLHGSISGEHSKEKLIKKEINLAKQARCVTTVSAGEKKLFAEYGIPNIHVVGFMMDLQPTPTTFDQRGDILFVGAIHTPPNPNEDAVLYFVEHIYPLVYKKTGAKLYVVGTNEATTVWNLQSEHIIVTGRVESVREYYNRCRIFVAPTRFAAGIPYKLYEAASYGVPAVVTPLIAEQVGRQGEECFLIGNTAEEFAHKCVELYTNYELWETVRQGALDMVKHDCSPERFKEQLHNALEM